MNDLPPVSERDDEVAATRRHQLADFLSVNYCARCDSFMGEQNFGTRWCPVCWKPVKHLPSSLRRTIEEVVGVRD